MIFGNRSRNYTDIGKTGGIAFGTFGLPGHAATARC